MHVGDEDLVRLIDGECSPDEEHAVREHLRTCRSCHDRLDLLTRTSARLSSALEALGTGDPTAGPRARRGRRWWAGRGAIALAAAAILAFGAGPVLGWLAERRTGASNNTGEDSATVISFVPQGERFVVELRDRQAAGTLVIMAAPVEAVSVRVSGGETGNELMVLRDGLRIGNDPASRGSYDLTLPTTLAEFEVRVGGVVVLGRRLGAGAAGSRWTLPLDRTAVR